MAKQFHEVVGYGLDLKERMEQGARPPLDYELDRLRGLLTGGSELKTDPEYSGDPGGGESRFLGSRYALTCWLDVIFIADSPYADEWNERKLEVAIYGGSSDRAWRFWEQTQMAERRSGTDAIEVFYWCVMLGFRGELREQPDKLHNWTTGIRDRIRKSHKVELSLPQDQGFTTYVPRLTGHDRFASTIKWAAALALVAVPLLIALVMRGLSS